MALSISLNNPNFVQSKIGSTNELYHGFEVTTKRPMHWEMTLSPAVLWICKKKRKAFGNNCKQISYSQKQPHMVFLLALYGTCGNGNFLKKKSALKTYRNV